MQNIKKYIIKFKYLLVFIAIIFISIVCLKIFAKPVLEDISFSNVVYDNNGKLLRLTLSSDEKYRLYTPLKDISSYIKESAILYEDKWFYYHAGINPLSLVRGFLSLFSNNSRIVGGSTITMQLARRLYNINSSNISGKIYQIFMALLLEIKYSKDEILEAYLNTAPYGYNIEGVGAASLIYFHSKAKNISLFEAFTLSVIPQNPNKRVPSTKKGAEFSRNIRKILFDKWINKYPEDIKYKSLISMDINIYSINNLPFYAPHFTDFLLLSGYKGSIYSTLDLNYQELAENTITSYIINNKRYNVTNASILLINYKTMEVKAYVGSSDYFNKNINGQVNGILSFRSPGSVLKPFIFALGLDTGLIHPKTMMKDAPRQYGAYSPENSDRGFLGPLFARDALIYSRNIPAIDLLNRLPASSFYNILKNTGVKNLQTEDFYGSSLAIGGFEVTMSDVAKLYAGLANLGEIKNIKYIKESDDNEINYIMFSKEAAYLTIDMLYYNPKPYSFLGNDAVAWKTGTSYGYRDGWSAGIFGDYILVVWVGNFNGKGNPYFQGRYSAGELFFNMVSALKRYEGITFEPIPLLKDLNIKEVDICAPTGDLPSQFCPEIEKGYFILGVSPIKITDVYRQIPIDKKTGLRACYYNPDTTYLKVYEFWSSDIALLFQKSGIRKEIPPKYMPDCNIQDMLSTGRDPVIITPSENSSYQIYNNSEKDIPFIASADRDADIIYWFLNAKYIGSSKTDEIFYWKSKSGNYIITASDNLGRSTSSKFSVQILSN